MNRKQRDQNRANARCLRREYGPNKNICWFCGKPGNHFVAPCFGEEGIFLCETIAEIAAKGETN